MWEIRRVIYMLAGMSKRRTGNSGGASHYNEK